MDTGEGRLALMDKMDELTALKEKFPNHGGLFKVGEVVILKGSRFKIQSVKPTGLRLKLLKRVKRKP